MENRLKPRQNIKMLRNNRSSGLWIPNGKRNTFSYSYSISLNQKKIIEKFTNVFGNWETEAEDIIDKLTAQNINTKLIIFDTFLSQYESYYLHKKSEKNKKKISRAKSALSAAIKDILIRYSREEVYFDFKNEDDRNLALIILGDCFYRKD